jgi:hypothetical protein
MPRYPQPPGTLSPTSTPTTARPTEEVGLPRREFLLAWLAANALGPIVANLLGLATRAAGLDLGLLDILVTLVMLTLPPWFVLKRYLLHLSAWEFLWRTALGWLLGSLIGLVAALGLALTFPAQGIRDATNDPTFLFLGILLAGLTVGLTVGLTQWPMLRRYAPTQPWFPWPLASSAAYGLSVTVTQLGILLGYTNTLDTLLTLLLGGLLGGLITGYTLLIILHQPASPQPGLSTRNRPPPTTYAPRPNKKRRARK